MKLYFASFLLIAFTASICSAGGAKTVSIRNMVEKQDLEGNWSRLRFGSTVQEKETVKTHENSEVTLKFESGSTMKVRENSSLTIETSEADGKTTRANWGKFDFTVSDKDKKSKFKVITPVAVAGAEGTAFSIKIDKNTGETEIILFSGVLKIDGIAEHLGTVIMTPGQLIGISSTSTELTPRAAPPEILRQNSNAPSGAGESGMKQPPEPAPDAGPAEPGISLETDSRLEATVQNATGGFISTTGDEQKDKIIIPPREIKNRSKVIIRVK